MSPAPSQVLAPVSIPVVPPRGRGRPPKDPARHRTERLERVIAAVDPAALSAALIRQLDAPVDVETVAQLTTLSKREIYRRVSDRTFPAPLPIGGKRKAWRISAIESWISTTLTPKENHREQIV